MKNSIYIIVLTSILFPFSASFGASDAEESCNGPNQELRSNGYGGSYCHTNIEVEYESPMAPSSGGVGSSTQPKELTVNSKVKQQDIHQERSVKYSTANNHGAVASDEDKVVCPNCRFRFQRVDNDLDVDDMIKKLKELQESNP